MAVLMWMDWRSHWWRFRCCRSSPHRALVPHQRSASYRNVRTLTRPDQRVPPGAHHRHDDRAAVPAEARDFRDLRRHRPGASDANVESIFYYAVFYPRCELVSALAASLIIWRGGAWMLEGSLTLGLAGRLLQYSSASSGRSAISLEKFNVLSERRWRPSERIFALLDTPVEIESGSGWDSGSAPGCPPEL
jgi:ABC-type multidrug transport system fused ATPase/permease subunit